VIAFCGVVISCGLYSLVFCASSDMLGVGDCIGESVVDVSRFWKAKVNCSRSFAAWSSKVFGVVLVFIPDPNLLALGSELDNSIWTGGAMPSSNPSKSSLLSAILFVEYGVLLLWWSDCDPTESVFFAANICGWLWVTYGWSLVVQKTQRHFDLV